MQFPDFVQQPLRTSGETIHSAITNAPSLPGVLWRCLPWVAYIWVAVRGSSLSTVWRGTVGDLCLLSLGFFSLLSPL